MLTGINPLTLPLLLELLGEERDEGEELLSLSVLNEDKGLPRSPLVVTSLEEYGLYDEVELPEDEDEVPE